MRTLVTHSILTALIGALALSGPALAQNYAYFHPTDDAYLDSGSPNGNFGGSTNLYLGDRTPASGGTCLFFLQFDISDFTASNEILQAELWLYKHEKYGTQEQQCTVDVHDILTPGWDENLITWNGPPAYSSVVSATNTGTFNPPGWAYWNVTADVIADMSSGTTGFAVRVSPPVSWLWLSFWSSEQVPMPDFRPTLEIMYAGPVAMEPSSLDAVKALYR